MPKCNFCGADISINDKKCPFCGSVVEIKKPSNVLKPNVNKPVINNNENKLNINKPVINNNENKPNINKPNISNVEVKKDLFEDSDWELKWKNKNGDFGIILMDTRNVNSLDNYLKSLKRFIEFKKSLNIDYEILDLKKEQVIGNIEASVLNIIELLRKIYKVKVPKYLLIIGDDLAIPKAIWDNKAGDNDEVVPSDLCYITLDTDSPWNGKEYNLNGVTMVGRIPASKNNGYIEAKIYFENVMNFKPYKELKGFAYSAAEWTERSQEIFRGFSDKLYLSPKYICTKTNRYPNGYILPRVKECNALGINLHGSSSTQYWYGQEGEIHPEAFSNDLLPNDGNYYIISVEACYGAKSKITIANQRSILLNALMNKCLGFVGSSMIAYGATKDYPLCCADIINKEFISGVKKGTTLGKAFIDALIVLLNRKVNEKTIKTLAEFALYGDPSLTFIENNQMVKMAFEDDECIMANVIDNCDYSFELVPIMENVSYLDNGRHEIDFMAYEENHENKMEIDNVANMVNQKSNDCVSQRFGDFSDIKPMIYSIYGRKEYRSSYQKNVGDFKEILSLHLDEDGNVTDVYISK